MLPNRSIPRANVIPVLAYPDVNQAAAWLCDVFGFSVRLRVDTHRVQLNVGDGAVIVREPRPHEMNLALGIGHSITVRVEDADVHCKRAQAHGAGLLNSRLLIPTVSGNMVLKTSPDTRGRCRNQ